MDRYVFPGYPSFLSRAAGALGLAAPPSWGQPPAGLAALANLCAQASIAEAGQVGAILKEAAAVRDHLMVAAKAGELMVQDLTAARVPAPPSPPPSPSKPAKPTSTSR